MADKSSQWKPLKEAAPEDLVELPPELMERLFPPDEINGKDFSSMDLEKLKDLTPREFVDYFESDQVAPEHEKLGELTIGQIAALGEDAQEDEDSAEGVETTNTINININVYPVSPDRQSGQGSSEAEV
jgi:hypothetical protein